jgi:hypothetical protein
MADFFAERGAVMLGSKIVRAKPALGNVKHLASKSMFFVEIEGRDPMDSPRLMYRQVSTDTASGGKTTGMSSDSKSAAASGRADKQETHNDADTPGARLDLIQSPSAYPKVNFE